MHGADFARVAASSLVTGIWQGLVLVTGIGLCLQWLPKTTAHMRFAVWAATFALLGALPLLHVLTGSASHGAVHAVVHADLRWSLGLAAIWTIFSLLRASQLILGAVRLRQVHRNATPIPDAPALRIGFRAVTLCTSADVDRPSVIGFFSPRILVPMWLIETLSDKELDQIVLHEMGHLHRGDDWLNLLQKIGLVLFPLNPALLWVERRLCLERELACDDDVLRQTGAPKSYATCLTRLAESRLERRALALTLGAWTRKSELTKRVYSILRRTEGMSRLQARVVLSVLLVALLGATAGLSRCRELIAFTAPPSTDAANWTAEIATAADMKAALQPVVFQADKLAAHETLLKASMPAATSSKTVAKKRLKPRPQLLKATLEQPRSRMPRTLMQRQQWVVMTTWNAAASEDFYVPAIAITTTQTERAVYTTYALPTPTGWLVIQL